MLEYSCTDCAETFDRRWRLRLHRGAHQLKARVMYADGSQDVLVRPNENVPFQCRCGWGHSVSREICRHTRRCTSRLASLPGRPRPVVVITPKPIAFPNQHHQVVVSPQSSASNQPALSRAQSKSHSAQQGNIKEPLADPFLGTQSTKNNNALRMGTVSSRQSRSRIRQDHLKANITFIYRKERNSNLVEIPYIDETHIVINMEIRALICLYCGVIVGATTVNVKNHLRYHGWSTYLHLIQRAIRDNHLSLLEFDDPEYLKMVTPTMNLRAPIEGIQTALYQAQQISIRWCGVFGPFLVLTALILDRMASPHLKSESYGEENNNIVKAENYYNLLEPRSQHHSRSEAHSHEISTIQPDHIVHDDRPIIPAKKVFIGMALLEKRLHFKEYMEKIDHQTIQSITAKPTGVFLNEESIANIRQSIAEGSICWTGLTKEFLVQYYTKLCSKIGGAYGISYVLRRALCNSKRDTLSKKLFRPLCESSSIDTHTETAMHLISVVMKLCQSTNDMLGQIPLEPIRAAIECLRAAILNAVEKFPEFEANTIYTAIQKTFRAIFCTDLAISKSRIHHGVFWFVVFDARLDATTTKDADGITRTIEQLLYLCRLTVMEEILGLDCDATDIHQQEHEQLRYVCEGVNTPFGILADMKNQLVTSNGTSHKRQRMHSETDSQSESDSD
ncbi:hypothetical protein BASA60_004472 [Batrachochytrium salamandrivorans]|nr:hypothetical protein BASA60_004472 [Batrachochytrium salamandrivorans]